MFPKLKDVLKVTPKLIPRLIPKITPKKGVLLHCVSTASELSLASIGTQDGKVF